MLNQMFIQLEELYPQMVDWRRYLHENPELSFQEEHTPKMIAAILEGYGIDVKQNVGGRGVVGYIKGGKPGKTIALRADFDALPIQDLKEVEYKSTIQNVMHACGHDGHTATLLAVAKVLNDNRQYLEGNVVLLHQHAEELPPGGAIAMIEDGCLDDVDYVFGTHLATSTKTGTYLVREKYTMAAADKFEIVIQGKGGHGAAPHETVDALAIGVLLINQLQYIVSRIINPLQPVVVTVGSFHAGSAHNIIADTATITGTVRCFDEQVRLDIEEEFNKIASGICSSTNSEYKLTYDKGYPALYNHPNETQHVINALTQTVEPSAIINSEPWMGGEDFAYYLKEKPGAFFFTGASNEESRTNFPHHHPKFDFDETAMIQAAKGLLSIVNYYLIAKKQDEIHVVEQL